MRRPPPGPGRRLFATLLELYPRRFRERHADEMRRLYREKEEDAWWRAGWRGLVGHWLTAAVDAVRSALGAHVDEWRESRRLAGTPMANARRGQRRRGGRMDSLMRDIRYAVRSLAKSRGFTVVATLTIALGIGANTAIFSVVQTVLLEPLPYEDPDELVLLWGEMRNRGVTHFPTSPPDYLTYRDQTEGLEDLGVVFTFGGSLTGDGDPIQIDIAGVSPNFLSVLGVEPLVGRSFVEEDALPDAEGVQPGQPGSLPGIALLSHALWQQRYGGATDVIGRTIELAGRRSEIVGVMPAGFELLMPPTAGLVAEPDVWVAARIDYANAPSNNVFLIPVGRLREGTTPEQLQPEIDRISQALSDESQSKATAGYAMRVESLHEDLTAEARPVLFALFGAVVFVLLIACANVSNLLLVRASGRDRELAVRAAMGGSRGALIRQMLIESGLLAAVGALIGVALASGGIALLVSLRPDGLPRVGEVGIDGSVLLFTVAAAAGAAVLFGVLPALQSSRVDLVDALKERGSAGAGVARKLLRNGVVVGEVALSLVLLIGAGLMARSFVELANVEPGYDAEGVLTFTASAPTPRYPEVSQRIAFDLELQRRFEALPGVERASRVIPLPLSGVPFNGRYGPEEALSDPEAFRQAAYRSVLPGYFEAMETRLLAGRTFSEADLRDSTGVVVIDEKLADALWPDTSPIGERFLIRVITPEAEWVEVIGVVEHQRAESLAMEGMETVYFHDRYVGSFGGTWTVRAGSDPAGLVGAIRNEVAAVDAEVPVGDVALMSSYVDDAMASTRFALTLIGIFGAIALVLAAVGLYGVLSFVVRQRTSEIGVRMAFGAQSESILKLVVGQGLALAGAGVVLGVLAALGLTRLMESFLVGVTPTDPVTFAAVSVLFVAVAAFSCWVPARRAAHVDPVRALREE